MCISILVVDLCWVYGFEAKASHSSSILKLIRKSDCIYTWKDYTHLLLMWEALKQKTPTERAKEVKLFLADINNPKFRFPYDECDEVGGRRNLS